MSISDDNIAKSFENSSDDNPDRNPKLIHMITRTESPI
jgi:hypothetical protein